MQTPHKGYQKRAQLSDYETNISTLLNDSALSNFESPAKHQYSSNQVVPRDSDNKIAKALYLNLDQ